jgi:small subunit ribosomal protein S18
MARSNDRDRNPKRAPKETRPRGKKKVCIFCKEHTVWVDYKDVGLLRRFVSERGKIRSRRVTGNCTQHQKEVADAVKTARELALLPYVQRTASERGPGRPPRQGQGRPEAVEVEEGSPDDAGVAYEDADVDIEDDLGTELAKVDA